MRIPVPPYEIDCRLAQYHRLGTVLYEGAGQIQHAGVVPDGVQRRDTHVHRTPDVSRNCSAQLTG